MKIRVAETHVYDLMDTEDEWWQRLRIQPMWDGEIESLSGPMDQIQIRCGQYCNDIKWSQTSSDRLNAPRMPAWFQARVPGAIRTLMVHQLTNKEVTLETTANKTVLVAAPDGSPIRGQCNFASYVIANEVEQGPAYLPGPELIKTAGIDFTNYELGTIFGDGVITFAWKEVPCKYKLKIGTPNNRISIVGIERTKDADETFLIFDGELAKGISDTFYIRGLYHIKTPLELTPDAIKRPFCIFQLTPGGSIPEVVTSSMGIRYAGLKQKSYTMLQEGLKLDRVCYP